MSKCIIMKIVPNVYFHGLISFTNFNAQLLYSLTICMLHYNPRHVSSMNMPIFRRTNCIITASAIIIVCKRLYSMPDESILLSSGILYSRTYGISALCALLFRAHNAQIPYLCLLLACFWALEQHLY